MRKLQDNEKLRNEAEEIVNATSNPPLVECCDVLVCTVPAKAWLAAKSLANDWLLDCHKGEYDMTKPQIELLKRCIRAARYAEKARVDDDCQGHHLDDFELVEVSPSVDKRTAQSLVDAGLLVTDMPTWTNEYTRTHVRLPRLDEKIGKPLIEIL